MPTEQLPTFMGSKTRHGTYSGHNLHRRRGEEPCDACWTAMSEYNARRTAATDVKHSNRLRARAQGRALIKLSHTFPQEYREFYDTALKAVLEEDAKLDKTS
jgi:hypothetical protein